MSAVDVATMNYEQMRLATIEAIKSVYRRHGAGCCLHVVTDDYNIYSTDYVLETVNKAHNDCMTAIQGLHAMRPTARRKAIYKASRDE